MGPEAGPTSALAAIWLLTSILTLLITNVAAAVVMLPIALSTAGQMGVSETPFVMAVIYAASVAFATPMGYQTNILVWNPGGYRFGDFVRVGLPLQVLILVLGVAFMPTFFPF